VDRQLSFVVAVEPNSAPGAMPAEAPLTMPAQDLERRPEHPMKRSADAAVRYARFILLTCTVGVTAYGIYQMLQVVRFASMTFLQGLMIFFFAVSLGWIAFSAGSVLAGLSKRRGRKPRIAAATDELTALVMPVYNEDPLRVTASLQAMAESLADLGAQRRFEIVVLSDSTDADAWVREGIAIGQLRKALEPVMPVWYRRRWKNVARKSGNVEEFVQRWGGRYAHMVVLDADSLIDGATLLALHDGMRADPEMGILQTAPQLIGATTFFGRLQQFAACVYGPVITRGLAAWSGDDGNYWGHNAIIRTSAFAACCGLPKLEGRKPFGGFVLSHDFVEAALMRRAGWKVCMSTELAGSWEESPPSLIDVTVRDRRWAQGNLQHSKIIGSAGLSFASRLHLGIGIMSYLSSPLWLALLALGFALALQARLIRPEYFSHDFQLFPTWPRFDVELMMSLFWFSIVVLLVPKMLGLVRALWSRRIRRGGGGVIGVAASVLLESVLSALYAPVLMMVQSGHVFDVLLGRDSGWKAQRRDGGGSTWGEAWDHHRKHMFLSIITAVIIWFLSPPLLAWVSPALLGLFLAVPLSKASGSRTLALALARMGLLRTPDEVDVPRVASRRQAILAAAHSLPADGLRHLASNREARLAHVQGNLPRPPDARGRPDPNSFTAEQKLRDARTLEEALEWLTPLERVEVAGDLSLLNQLASLPDAPRASFKI
jgi:membrane glycosyltransferase